MRAALEGLTWWQAVLALVPLGIVPIGGAIGGGLGGGAAAMNVSLARKDLPAAAKALAMISVDLAAIGVFLIISDYLPHIFSSSTPSTSASAPFSTPTPARAPNTANIQPPGDAGWQSQRPYPASAVTVAPPTVIHATGAELSWSTYTNPTGKATDDLIRYEIYRSLTDDFFTPSPTTLLATVDANTTSFVDTTEPALTPYGRVCYYTVAVRTRSGALIRGPIRLARLPQTGQTAYVVEAAAATTLSSAQRTTVLNTLTAFGVEHPWLEVGDDTTGYGVTRAIFDFGQLIGVPAHPAIVDAHLVLWDEVASDTWSYGRYTLHGLSNSFIGTQSTWNSATAAIPWSRPGGDFAKLEGLGLGPYGEEPHRRDFDATAIIRGWFGTQGANANHGLLLKLADERPSSQPLGVQEQAYFGGMGVDDPAQLPALVITVADS